MKLALALASTTLAAVAAPGQVAWQQRSGTGPLPRYITAMAHDSVRGRTVLFGGRNGTTLYGDTWEWNGTAWTQKSPPFSPSPRSLYSQASAAAPTHSPGHPGRVNQPKMCRLFFPPRPPQQIASGHHQQHSHRRRLRNFGHAHQR